LKQSLKIDVRELVEDDVLVPSPDEGEEELTPEEMFSQVELAVVEYLREALARRLGEFNQPDWECHGRSRDAVGRAIGRLRDRLAIFERRFEEQDWGIVLRMDHVSTLAHVAELGPRSRSHTGSILHVGGFA
jgi:hypothetical protein